MKKIFLFFLVVFSFQIFPEGRYTEAAKKATELTHEQLKDREKELLSIPEDILVVQKLFEGDIEKIAKESAENANKELGINVYIKEMKELIEELRNEKSDQ